MRVYLACPLTGAGIDYYTACAEYERFATMVKRAAPQADLILPHLFDPSTGSPLPLGSADYQAAKLDPAKVYEFDLKLILGCDIVLAWADRPSHGMAAEVTLALQADIDVIVLKRGRISKFFEGMLDSHGCVKLDLSQWHSAALAVALYIHERSNEHADSRVPRQRGA